MNIAFQWKSIPIDVLITVNKIATVGSDNAAERTTYDRIRVGEREFSKSADCTWNKHVISIGNKSYLQIDILSIVYVFNLIV